MKNRVEALRGWATRLAGGFVALACAACSQTGADTLDDKRMAAAGVEPANWMIHGGTFDGAYYSTLDQITPDNVGRLAPAWSFDFDTYRGQESEPIVVDGVLYVTTAWSKVYALDAATGAQLWFFDPEVPGRTGGKVCCDVVNRGVAVYRGKVFLGTLDGRMIALDAKTGTQLWSTRTVPEDATETITGAPTIAKGKVIIGNGGGEYGGRGSVSAYDTETGDLAWRFWLVPGNPETRDGAASDAIMESLVRPTWAGEYWLHGGGGNAWNAISYDPELDQLYIGTGNGSPWNPELRSERTGDNLFLASVVALDPDTGEYIWHYQEVPKEAWDYNSAAPIIVTTLPIDGVERKVLLHAPKSGFFYVIDRETGKLISAENIVPVTWAKGYDLATGRPNVVPGQAYENGPVMVKPSPAGGHNWTPMSLSGQTGLVYIGALESGAEMIPIPVPDEGKFIGNRGARMGTMLPFKPSLLAWDPVAQKEAWRIDGGGGGLMSTASGLLFQGTGSVGAGALVARDAASGQELWHYDTPNGIRAVPITYEVDGVQYVAVVGGAGGMGPGGGMAITRQPGRIFVFKLDGTAKFPAGPAAAPPISTYDEKATAAQLQEGFDAFNFYCSRCHGANADSPNVVPDLRRSQLLADHDAWNSVVLEGAFEDNGMIGWKQWISDDTADAIRLYAISEAKAVRTGDFSRRPKGQADAQIQ